MTFYIEFETPSIDSMEPTDFSRCFSLRDAMHHLIRDNVVLDVTRAHAFMREMAVKGITRLAP